MHLFERVKIISRHFAGSDTSFAARLGLKQPTFFGYLNEKRQDNLWPLLPKILELYPQVRRDWLYFGEGDMTAGEGAGNADTGSERQPRPKLLNNLGYYDDALGRIFVLTRIRTTSAFELQTLFGADFKEAKRFISRYMAARIAREEWEAAGADEATMPPAPEAIPDEWLHYFWTHFGPNPTWVQHGETEVFSPPPLREWPREAEREHVRHELEEARREIDALREQLKGVEWEKGSDKTALSRPAARGGVSDGN